MSLPFSLLERCRALETNWNNVGASGENLLTLVEAIYKGKQEGALDYDEDDLLAGLCDLFLSWPLQAASVTVSELATHMKRGLQLLYTAYGVEGVTPVATTLTDTKITSLYATWENLGPYGDALRTLCYAINAGPDEEDQVTYTPADMAEALGGMAASMVLNPLSLSFEDFVLIAQTGIDALIEDAGGEVVEPTPPTDLSSQASQPTVPGMVNPGFGEPGGPATGQTQIPMVVTPFTPSPFEVDGSEVVVGGPYTYTLTNSGTLGAAWEVTGVPSWLQMSQTTGTVRGGKAVPVTASLLPAGVAALDTGVYTAVLNFKDLTTNTNNPRLVTLDWTVPTVDPVLSFAPFENYNVTGTQGNAGSFGPLTKTYIVTNIGPVEGDWSVALSPSWLTVAPGSSASGTLAPGASASVRLTFDPAEAAALNEGVLTGSITWTNVDTTDEAVLSFNVEVLEAGIGGDGSISQPTNEAVGLGSSGVIADPAIFSPPGPLPEEDAVVFEGPFYDVYGSMETRPYGRIELDYTKFEGPDCRTITITWVAAQSKWAVVVDGVTVHNGTTAVNNPGFPVIENNKWNESQIKEFIIGFCYRNFRDPSKTFHRINLTWVSGMPTFGGIGVGSSGTISLPQGSSQGTLRNLYHGDGSPVRNLLITAADTEGNRVKVLGFGGSTAGGGYDGVVLRHLEIGPDNDSLAPSSNYGFVTNPIKNYNGFLAIEGCYFKPAPYQAVGANPSANFRSQYWGLRMYTPGGLLVRDCIFGNVGEMRLFGEHCLYLSNCRNFVFIENNTAAPSSRTFCQITNRRGADEGAPDGPNGGSGYGPVVIRGNTTPGTFWPAVSDGFSGGSAFTIAGHLGPVYLDENTIPGTIPTFSTGTWNRRGGGYVFWSGGKGSGVPATQFGGITWNVHQEGDTVFLDDEGFAISLVWVGQNSVDVTVPGSGGWIGGHALTTQSVRDFFLYLGSDQVIEASVEPKLRLDFLEEGIGNAEVLPHIGWDEKIRVTAIESKRIRLFDTYEAEVTAPSITSVAPTAVFDDLIEGLTARRPCGGVLKGTTITELAWSFDNSVYDPMVPALNMSELQEYSTGRWFLAANLMASEWRETNNLPGNTFNVNPNTLTFTDNLAPAALTGTKAARLFFHDKNPSAAPYPFQGQTWILTWEGDPDARLYFDGNVTGGTITPSGRRQGTTVSPNRVSINVGTSNSGISIVLEPPYDDTDPIHSLRFFPLSQEGNLDTVIFIPELLNHLEGVELIRFMNVQQTNNSEVTTTADRRPITACYQGSDSGGGTGDGMTLELMVELCNAIGADMWYCAPHKANDALLEADAAFIAANLDVGLKCYVEYSNEVWNPTFTQRAYCLAQANLLSLTGDDATKVVKFQAKRSAELFAIFEAEFGGLSRLVRVGAVQNTGAYYVETFLDFVHDSPNTLADITDMMAIAPYFGSNVAGDEFYAQSVNWTETQIANKLRHRVANGTDAVDTTPFWTNPIAAQAAATARGVAFGCYEGGQSLVPNGQAFASTGANAAANAAFWARLSNVNRSEAMGEITRAYMRCLKYRGYQVFPIYRGDVDSYGSGQYGSWGIGEYYGHNLPKEVAWREETGLV